MPEIPSLNPIQADWLAFVDATQVLLVVQIDDRPLDQYLEFRGRVLRIVRSTAFLNELDLAWTPPAPSDSTLTLLDEEVKEALQAELQAFPRAVEVARSAASSDSEKKGWFSRLLGRASTVSGSVDDILDDALPPYAKAGIKLFRELVDLFKSKD